MNITASYSETGMIDAAIDGVDMVVPDDMENRHRVMIAEWEAEGNIITPYEAPAASVPDRVTARQFKLHLLSSGYLDDVETWVAGQSQAVQIAYENSGTFVRDEPMLESGFAGLGFTSAQIDTFFAAAAEL